jgi:hypothetical protein
MSGFRLENLATFGTKMLTIRSIQKHGQRRWQVDARLEGRRVREVYLTKAEAQAQLETLQLQRRDAGDAWLTLSPAERNEVMAASASHATPCRHRPRLRSTGECKERGGWPAFLVRLAASPPLASFGPRVLYIPCLSSAQKSSSVLSTIGHPTTPTNSNYLLRLRQAQSVKTHRFLQSAPDARSIPPYAQKLP